MTSTSYKAKQREILEKMFIDAGVKLTEIGWELAGEVADEAAKQLDELFLEVVSKNPSQSDYQHNQEYSKGAVDTKHAIRKVISGEDS